MTEPLDLDALEALAESATPGPWTYPGIDSVSGGLLYGKDVAIVQLLWDAEPVDGRIRRTRPAQEADQNGAFIAAARSSVPTLITEVRRLKRLVGEDD